MAPTAHSAVVALLVSMLAPLRGENALGQLELYNLIHTTSNDERWATVEGACSVNYWRMERTCVFNSQSTVTIELTPERNYGALLLRARHQPDQAAIPMAMLLIPHYRELEQCPTLGIQNTTMPHTIETESVHYCVGDGPCTSVAACLAFDGDKRLVSDGGMERANLHPGYTYCQPFPNVSSCGGGDACLFFCVYAKPTATFFWANDYLWSLDPRALSWGQPIEQPLAGRGAESGSIEITVVETEPFPLTRSHFLISDLQLGAEKLASKQNMLLCKPVDPRYPAFVRYEHCLVDEESFECRVGWSEGSDDGRSPFALCESVGQQYDFDALDERLKQPRQKLKGNGFPVEALSDLVLDTRSNNASRVVLAATVTNVSTRHYIGISGVLTHLSYEYPALYNVLYAVQIIIGLASIVRCFSEAIKWVCRVVASEGGEDDGDELQE